MRLAESTHVDFRGDVLSLIEQMRGALNDPSRFQRISNQMEMLVRTYLEPAIPDTVPGVRFSLMEARILARLLKVEGSVVSRHQIMDAMYFDRAGDEPDIKIVDILICRLRKKLKGSKYAIENIWGVGYKVISSQCQQ